MKVLQINAVNGLSSTGRVVQELASGLEARGIECSVAYSYGPAPERGYVIGTRFERMRHALGSRIVGKQGYFSKRGTRGLIRFIETESPDVVHLHNLHGNYVNLRMLLGHLASRDIPTVLTLHDCWFYTGKCCHYVADHCFRWESQCGSCPRLRKDNPSWFFDASAEMLAAKKALFEAIPRLAVVGVSDWITGEAARSILSCASLMTRIYNWIDLSVFAPADDSRLRCDLGVENKYIVLGVASRWTDKKGLSSFIELAHLLERAEPHVHDGTNRETQIVLVGAVEHGLSLPPNVTSVGQIEDVQGLAEYYSMADVFLQLSSEESFGKVTAEALACGTPVIAYESTANSELIEEAHGRLVEPGNVSELTRMISQVAADAKASYTRQCRFFAEANFDMNAKIDDHCELYRQLCGLGQ